MYTDRTTIVHLPYNDIYKPAPSAFLLSYATINLDKWNTWAKIVFVSLNFPFTDKYASTDVLMNTLMFD